MAISDNPILTDDQKLFLTHFRASSLLESFYLTEGTAFSAFFLHHRLSEDLDFFSEQPVWIEEVLAFIKSLPQVSEVQYVIRLIHLFLLMGQVPQPPARSKVNLVKCQNLRNAYFYDVSSRVVSSWPYL